MNIYTVPTAGNTIAFLYKWVETNTNKWYIGSRTAAGCHPGDGYICSSRIVRPLILDNPTLWTRQILAIGDPEYIGDLEGQFLKLLDAKNDPMSYNQHNGDGKFSTRGITSWNAGKDLNNYIMKNGEPYIPSWKGKESPLKGRTVGPYSEQRCANISAALKGSVPWNAGVTKQTSNSLQKISDYQVNLVKEGSHNFSKTKGVPKSEEHKQKQRKPKHPGHGAKVSAARKGKPLIKAVCRLCDRKEMSMNHYTAWENRQAAPST